MLIVNSNVRNCSELNKLNSLIFNYFYKDDAKQDRTLNKQLEKGKNYLFLESSVSSLSSTRSEKFNNFDGILTINILKINIIFMVFSIFALALYSFLLKVEVPLSKREKSNEKQSELLEKENEAYSDDEDDEDDEIESAFDSKGVEADMGEKQNKYELVLNTNDPIDNFIYLKRRKLEKKSNIEIHWIVHSLFVIYLLNIWDVADVYQYFRVPNLQLSNMNVLLNKDSGYNKFLDSLNDYNSEYDNLVLVNRNKNNKQILKTDENKINLADLENIKKDPNFQGTISYLNDYYNKYDGSFYQHYLHHHNKQQFIKNNANSSISHQYKTTTTIKALFVLKLHSQFFGDLLIVCFSFIILIKLKAVEDFINWNSKYFLYKYKCNSEKHSAITLI
jgi:hypothetical protein